MRIIINVFGPEIVVNKEIVINSDSADLRDVLTALKERPEAAWKRILKDDLSLEKDCVILVNGRNVSSLHNLEPRLYDGDEITLTVLMAGG
jgi:molybdopterin converting factor small subunit